MRGPTQDTDLATQLALHESRDRLRFITCGSVDDGKSTLIGRLLHDSRQMFTDQLDALARDSRRHGTQGEALDFALLVDGLDAEREQGITIDVAYRFFGTPKRSFIVADCPGHAQYTRNMATGASTADLAVVLVDARKGLLPQTHRHSYLCALLGIRHVILAVNKMDLIGYDRAVFDTLADDYRRLAHRLGIEAVDAIPLSALQGDNLVTRSDAMPWYDGPSLLSRLENVDIASSASTQVRLPVQWVCRPHADFRGYAGTLGSGQLRRGDPLLVLPSGRTARVDRLFVQGVERDAASAGDAVLLTLDSELDISRGDLLASADAPLEIADQFAAHLVWMDDAPLLPGRAYWLRIGSASINATVTEIKHRVDPATQDQLAAKQLALNDIAVCNLSLDRAIPFAPYAQDRSLGGFVLIDRVSHATVAAGTLDFALRRAGNIHWQHLDVDRHARAALKAQTPRCLWFTGLSGSGKSTIANLVEKRLLAEGRHTYLLDGDNVRHGLNKDLGFTDADRVENIRRVAEVARLMVDAGLIVLVSFISPFRAERQMARSLFGEGEFIEVFVDTPLEECERRDVKGLYRKARIGQLPNFTGIDAPYETPESPELHLRTLEQDAAAAAERVVGQLMAS